MDRDLSWKPGEPLDPAFVDRELGARADLMRGDFSRWQGPGGCQLREKLTGYPERLFLFRLEGRGWYAGYKTISDYVVDANMPGVFCSRIYWFNVVGLVDSVRVSDEDARVVFRPLDVAARRTAFDLITPLTEIVHPFGKQRDPGREKTSPPDGWLVSDERAAFLALGEQHIRRYTREVFGPRFACLDADVLAYDPACSTGRFLRDFAALNPARIRTVGQDLSRQMVDFAGKHIERVFHEDAMRPVVAPASVDILFSRFLNSEVVSTARAREILPGLVRTLRPGGLMVLLGHSPLLVDAADLADAGLRVTQTVARADDYLFQYYICERGD
ncbi:class I SAM-dependent methyltransferase [Microbispora triticiradicis]|uniref:Class I SAM-dependent methyltransferase n=1 Tax=Microbispora triticiradicis TaxID=2200763 RepID=A0ABX9LNF6_9ACTN|nr:class I SAM-dependent methyltransferase [Microbispora triticiradicis]RGA05526.1 class I SAM-dependent methyltransferase [Microbispora triticiradicis]